MTVREAFNSILDGSFTTVINGGSYATVDCIPQVLLDMEIKVIRPYNGKEEGYYRIIVDDSKPTENVRMKLTKANGYNKTRYWFCITPGVCNRTVYEKNGEYFIQYEGKIRKVNLKECLP